jgi:hypothetical protein
MYSKLTFFLLGMILMPLNLAFAATPIDLGTAGNYVVLTKTGVSCVPSCAITGDVGISPIDSTALTGFSLTLDPTNLFSTSPLVTGKLYAANYAAPTPSNLTTAISNMETAYTDAAGRTPDYTELHTGDLSGKTLQPGVYKWGTGILINSDVTLDGDGVFIFQIAKGITQATGTKIILTGGAQAKNIFWQTAETVSIGTGAHFEGIVLTKVDVDVKSNASINGRLLAQTAVTLIQTTIGISTSDTQDIVGGAQISGDINASEGGANGSYTIALSSQPSGDVEITATADAQTQVSNNGTTFGSTAVFTFTPSNWNTIQTVTVKAIDDTVVEGNHTGTLTHAITGTVIDESYPTTLTLDSVLVNITDNDKAGISGAQIGGNINASEGGANGSYTFALSSQPSDDIKVTATASAQTQVSNNGTTFGSTAVFTFTPNNWNTIKTVTVKAIDDTVVEGNHTETLTHAITGAVIDESYPTTLTLGSVTVNITDNDKAGISVDIDNCPDDPTDSCDVSSDTSPPLETEVTVAFGGTGKGKVISDPNGIDCQTPTACSYTFNNEGTIKLLPTPIGQSSFQKWGAGCSDGELSASGGTKYCVVYFVDTSIPSYTLTTSVTGEGLGIVIAEGISCGDDCTNDFEKDTQVMVSTDELSANSQFMGWQGDCSGTDYVTEVLMDSDKNCTAIFDVISEEPVVEPEPVTPEPIVDDVIPLTDDGQTPPLDEPAVDEPIVDEAPVEPPVTEEPPVADEEPLPEPETPVIPEPVTTPPVDVLLPPVNNKICPPKDVLSYYCNAQGQTIGDLNITKSGFLSNAVVEGNLTLETGTWASNLEVSTGSQVIGGVITGLNYNRGYMGDFEFKGEFIKGGLLGGFILNTSKIRSWFEDVKLAPNSHLIGGALKGKIKGDPDNPAFLENLRILSGSVVSGVIIGNGVKIDKDVEIEKSIQDDTPADEAELPALDEQFSAGISINGSSYQNKNVAQILSDVVSMRGRIHVNKNHVGKKANLFVTVAYRLSEDNKEEFLFTVNHTNGLMPWNGKQKNIGENPFRTGEILQTVQTVKIYDGILLATGVVNIQFGYILEDGSVVQSAEGIALTTTD